MPYQSAAVRQLGPFTPIWSRASGPNLVCPISGQTKIEEIANVATHGFGWLLSVAGLVVLVIWASLLGNPWLIVGSSIFGATLVLAYAGSTTYHACSSLRFKPLLRTLDESLVYLLIAGTYTPIAFGPLFGGWGWSLFGITWGVSALGIGLKILFASRFRRAAIATYLAMGWLCVVAIAPLLENLELGGLVWLFLGGCAYSCGIIFMRWSSLPFNHAAWHLAVMAGSICHYIAILFYVLLPA
jgi:hemolysin III